MLYLEDYLEMIEHLPQELRDRFTEMRELDLSVQNNVDTLEKRVKMLFNDCKRMPELTPDIETEFQNIRSEYHTTLVDADEKVHLASTMYDVVDRYLRRLDTELHKFKCELEADNKGITEVLEKRSLELDTPLSSATPSSQKENRYERYNRPRSEKRRDSNTNINSFPEKRQAVNVPTLEARSHNSVSNSTNVVIPSSNSPSPQYSLSHIGAGQAIATAASQAIAATQQMQQGRRTASLKASYAAISGELNNVHNMHELAIGKDLAGAAQTAFQQSIPQDTKQKKQKKVTTNIQQVITQPAGSSTPTSPAVDVQTQEVTDGEWTYDPNEPRYCLCNQVSYGDMVACDNEECPSEWFHYPCVGITAPPKGKWYCPQCSVTMRRRSRKN